MIKPIVNKPLYGCLLAGILAILMMVNGRLAAQGDAISNAADDWSAPINLSRSGATSAPQIVIDSNGRYHALWRDEIDGFAYVAGDGSTWGRSAVVETPFSTRRFFPDLNPQQPTPHFDAKLAADGFGNLHAFWIDDSDKNLPILYHSQTRAGDFTNFDSWSQRTALDAGAFLPAATIDGSGRLHIAYIRHLEADGRSAGVYHQSLGSGGAWSGPGTIAVSRYLRATPADNANVQVLATDGEILVAWDDLGREQVFVARSGDSGRSWEPVQEIDRRAAEDSFAAAGPQDISLGQFGDTLMSIWRAGHDPGQSCTQYYRTSTDGGRSWSLPARVSDGLAGCFSSTQLWNTAAGLIVLGLNEFELSREQTEQTATLLAWDGTRWSDPQTQPFLSSFANPETNQSVMLRCLQGVVRGDRLSVIGCDEGIGRDIWWLGRAIGEATNWFPQPSAWQGPNRIGTATTPIDGLQVVSDEFGSTHAFWFVENGNQVFHSRWQDDQWSSPIPVVSLQNGAVVDLSVASGNRRLYMVWRDNNGLFFTQASPERPSEWSPPQLLDSVADSATAPFLLVANNGDLLIAYAVPLNEQRGIYLLRSEDLGTSWSAPHTVFDAEVAGWEMVDGPRLAQTTDGALHALYSRKSLPPAATPLDLGLSRSDTDGRVWTSVENTGTSPAVWADLLASGQVVHRLWSEESNQREIIWHIYSADGGLVWGEKEEVGGISVGQHPAAVIDPSGQLHLVGMDGNRLAHLFWTGTGWEAGESLSTILNPGSEIDLAADAGGQLIALISATIPGQAADSINDGIYSMIRSISMPDESISAPQPIPATPQADDTPVPTAEPSPTPTIVFSVAPDSNPLNSIPGANSRFGQLGLALLPAGVVILIAVIVGVRAIRMGGMRQK